MAQDGGYIAGQEIAAVANAQNQRAVLAHGNNLVRRVGAQDAQRIRAFNPVQAAAHGVQDVRLPVFVEVFHQLGDHLCVCLRGEGYPLFLEEIFQLRVIFNDAVMYHGNLAAAADLGMGVGV
jgi:hypothetical protein